MPTRSRSVNPSQIRFTGTEYVAVTKVGDWFGTTIFLDRAPAPQGPWTTYARVRVYPKCDPIDLQHVLRVVGADEHHRRAVRGRAVAQPLGRRVSSVNRPTFFTVPSPGQFALGTRCSLVDC